MVSQMLQQRAWLCELALGLLLEPLAASGQSSYGEGLTETRRGVIRARDDTYALKGCNSAKKRPPSLTERGG